MEHDVGSTSVVNYYVNASNSGPTDPDSAWTNDANAFDNDATPSTFAEATATGSITVNELTAAGTSAPTSGPGTISQVRVRIYAQARAAGNYVYAYTTSGSGSATPYLFGNTSGWGSWETMSVPSGGWTWQKVHDISTSIYLQGGGTTNTGKIYKVEIEVTYTVTGIPAEYEVGTNTDITKSAAYAVRLFTSYIKDDFDDNSLDTSKWTNWGGAQVAETSNQLRITSTGAPGYYGINTAGLFNLTGSYIKMRLAEAPPTNIGSLEVDMSISKDANNRYQIIWYMNGGTATLLARKKVAGISTDLGSIAFNFATMNHWRIVESAGTVSIQYSGDGVSWTNLGTNATSAFDIKDMYTDLEAGTWQASGNTAVIKIDDFNYTFSNTDITKSADYDVSRSTDITKTAEYAVIIPQVNVFATAWLKPFAGTNDTSIGSFAFTNPINIESGNAGYAHFFHSQAGPTLRNKNIKLVKDGVIGGNNLGNAITDVFPFSLTTYTFGAQTNMWGHTLTPDDVNDPTFGVVYGVGVYNPSLTSESNYLKGLDYRANIPTANTFILGVEARVTWTLTNVGGGTDRAEFYDLEMRVHYGIVINWESQNFSQGYARFDEEVFPETDMTKTYQYEVFDNEGNFVGEWKDAIAEPKVINALNSIPGDLRIELARNITEVPKLVETIDTEPGDEPLIDNFDQDIYGQFLSQDTLGSGSDLDVNFDVNVNEYYGAYEPLVNENGEEILTPDLQFIGIPRGYPHGRSYYKGFISNFGIQYSGSQSKVMVRLLHQAEELNNEIYKTADVLQITSYYTGDNNNYQEFGGSFFDEDTESVGWNFQTGSAFVLGSMGVKIMGWTGNVITATLRTGSTVGSGTVLATAQATIVGNLADPVHKLMFSFLTPYSLAASTNYNITLDASLSKTHGSGSHTAYLFYGSALANSQAYANRTIGGWTALTPSGQDYSFELYSYGGDTTVQHNSVDPTAIFQSIMDYNLATGGIVRYLTNEVETTNTVVSAKFNTNTIKEALDYNLKLSPSDWYYYIDSGETDVEYRARQTDVAHVFRLGHDIIDIEVNKTMEQMVNLMYFTGGANNPPFRDTFTDTANKDILAHTANSGHTYVKHPSSAGSNSFVITSENRLIPSWTSGEDIYYTTVNELVAGALSDDYTIYIDYYQKSYTADFGVIARVSASAQTYYLARIQPSSNQVQLYACIAGAYTLIASATWADKGNGSTAKFEYRLVGNNHQIWVDGSKYIELSNAQIMFGRRVGFRAAAAMTESTGLHIDNFYVGSDANSRVNILRKYQDPTSIQAYRKMLRKQSDNRVTDFLSADVLGTAEINQYKNPLFAARLRVLRLRHESLVKPGQLVQLDGFGNFIDEIDFIVQKVTTTSGTWEIELGLLLPRVSKRVEDIKRNLNLVEQQNNPTAPQ